MIDTGRVIRLCKHAKKHNANVLVTGSVWGGCSTIGVSVYFFFYTRRDLLTHSCHYTVSLIIY